MERPDGFLGVDGWKSWVMTRDGGISAEPMLLIRPLLKGALFADALALDLPCTSDCVPSWSMRSTAPSSSVSSPSLSSPLSSSSERPEVMHHTPKKVRAQPPTNLPASSGLSRSKSRYRIALPMITDKVNITNCVGITTVALNLCSARLRYLICMMAVETKIASRR